MGTHRNKIGAGKVPDDSRGCADAHVADNGKKPPISKQGRERTERVRQLGKHVRLLQGESHHEGGEKAPKKGNCDLEHTGISCTAAIPDKGH